MVLADPDILPGVNAGAALANYDRSGCYQLTAKALYAQALGIGIASIARTSACFLVCHKKILSWMFPDADRSAVDGSDFNLGERLPVPLMLLVVLAPAQLEYSHLLVPAMRDDFGFDACTC